MYFGKFDIDEESSDVNITIRNVVMLLPRSTFPVHMSSLMVSKVSGV